MWVKTLKAHTNGFGEKFIKEPGDVYDHPTPSVLLTRGKVEETTPPRRRRARKA